MMLCASAQSQAFLVDAEFNGASLRRRLAVLAGGFVMAAAVWLPASAWALEGAKAAGDQVDRFHGVLLEAMRTNAFAARMALLEPAVKNFFDVATIARISVGASWRSLPDAQRTAFTEFLQRLIVATYAYRFDSYGGQRFERVDAVAAAGGLVVKSQLVRANGEAVNLDYYFRGGKVFNVVADGVSDLSLRRADYASIIRKKGFVALVEHIKANIAEAGAAPPT